MALLNRFSKLNDRGETGIFTFIVTKSVTRDVHRDATTKDFCFGYHRWAISFQRPTEKMLGVHLLLRNASPSTACVVDFTLALLNREHFSQNQVYTKKQAKFTITNPMQGVSRWIELAELAERRFSNETGEFLFELSLSNMTTIFECDIQLNPSVLGQYKHMLKQGSPQLAAGGQQQQQSAHNSSDSSQAGAISATSSSKADKNSKQQAQQNKKQQQLINLETNCFTFGAFDWSLTIVPLVVPGGSGGSGGAGATSPSRPAPTSNGSGSGSATNGKLEPVCRIYLNRLNGFDSLCRVKYRVILGHHQTGGQNVHATSQSAEFVDSKQLDQISDCGGRIRGYQFRQTNILKLISLRHTSSAASSFAAAHTASGGLSGSPSPVLGGLRAHQHHHSAHTGHHHHQHHGSHHHGALGRGQQQQQQSQASASVDLRVHIEMFCANTISEAKVALQRKQHNEQQLSNCSDRNKQAWCIESDNESGETLKLKLFFMDLQSVPRNHIRYISWIAYLVRRDPKSLQARDSVAVKNSPHSNYYLQDGIDMGTIMDTDVQVKELNKSPLSYLDEESFLTVHIEWVDSLLLFSHLYSNYDALATVQRHQISRELEAVQRELEYLERQYAQVNRSLSRLSSSSGAVQQASERSLARVVAAADEPQLAPMRGAAGSLSPPPPPPIETQSEEELEVEDEEEEPRAVAFATASSEQENRPASLAAGQEDDSTATGVSLSSNQMRGQQQQQQLHGQPGGWTLQVGKTPAPQLQQQPRRRLPREPTHARHLSVASSSEQLAGLQLAVWQTPNGADSLQEPRRTSDCQRGQPARPQSRSSSLQAQLQAPGGDSELLSQANLQANSTTQADSMALEVAHHHHHQQQQQQKLKQQVSARNEHLAQLRQQQHRRAFAQMDEQQAREEAADAEELHQAGRANLLPPLFLDSGRMFAVADEAAPAGHYQHHRAAQQQQQQQQRLPPSEPSGGESSASESPPPPPPPSRIYALPPGEQQAGANIVGLQLPLELSCFQQAAGSQHYGRRSVGGGCGALHSEAHSTLLDRLSIDYHSVGAQVYRPTMQTRGASLSLAPGQQQQQAHLLATGTSLMHTLDASQQQLHSISASNLSNWTPRITSAAAVLHPHSQAIAYPRYTSGNSSSGGE